MSKSLNTGAAGAKKVTQAFAGIAGLTLVAGGGLVFCLNSKINASQAVVANREAQVGSSEQVTKRLDATKAAYDEARSRIAPLETSVAEKSFVPTLLQQLQTLAATTNLTVTLVHPSAISTPAAAPVAPPRPAGDGPSAAAGADAPKKKAAPPPYDTLNVDLSVVGSYANTVKFFYDLTRFPKILSVEGAQFHPESASSDTGKQGAPQVNTELKLTAFVFHDESAAPTTAGPAAAVKRVSVAPPPAAPTVAGAAGRAAQGAAAATSAANGHSQAAIRTL